MEEVATGALLWPAAFLLCCSAQWCKSSCWEAKTFYPSRGGALKRPAWAHTVRPLKMSWDVKGKAGRANKRNWTEAMTIFPAITPLSDCLGSLLCSLQGKWAQSCPTKGQNRAEGKGNIDRVVKWLWTMSWRERIIFPTHVILQNGDTFLKSGRTGMWHGWEEIGLATSICDQTWD